MKLTKLEIDRENNLQRECKEFVNRNQFIVQSALVDELIEKEFFSIDDIQNLSRPYQEKILAKGICEKCHSEVTEVDDESGYCKPCYEENPDQQEPLEWWLVDQWVKEQLLKHNEVILENDYGQWWGRQTSGQSISQDVVIRRIVKRLEK